MSTQDKLEQVLRDMHILLSNSEVYDKETNRVIIDKRQMLELFKRLNISLSEMVEQYELTQRGREKARLEAKKIGEDVVRDASRKAEDMYAASVLYTDEALVHVQEIMQNTMDSMQELSNKLNLELKQQKENVRRDQSDLKEHLQNLVDTDKYLKLIEERNKEQRKEKEKEQARQRMAAGAKPEKGKAKEQPESAQQEQSATGADAPETAAVKTEETPEKTAEIPEVKVNLDAEYFRQQEELVKKETAEQELTVLDMSEESVPDAEQMGAKTEKQSLFSRLKAGK